ncbi:hypothetical protein BDQ17DRAFT_1250940, partial [Cyathus striatus]
YCGKLIKLIKSHNQCEYELLCHETGITKPSLIDGLQVEHHFGVIGMLVLDFMHIPTLNFMELILGLFCGSIKCEPVDSKQLGIGQYCMVIFGKNMA